MESDFGRRLRLPAIAILLCSLCGCASSNQTSADDPSTRTETGNDREIIFANTNGLEIRRRVFRSSAATIADALIADVDTDWPDEQIEFDLGQDGLALNRIPLDVWRESEARMPNLLTSTSTWHGQVHDWRDVHTGQVSEPGCAIAINGSVSWCDAGRMQLLSRCWTVLTENGPRMNVEMVPVLYPAQQERSVGLFGFRKPKGHVIGGSLLNIRLESGFVYVLHPYVGDDLRGARSRMLSTASDDEAATPLIEQRAAVPSRNAFGPDVSPARTLGSVLLGGHTDQTVRILVLIPRIPADLYPDATQAGELARGAN